MSVTNEPTLNRPHDLEVALELLSFAGGENTISEDHVCKADEARVLKNWDSVSLGGMERSKGFNEVANADASGSDSYNTLLLHCDGTNTSTTITDSSSRANTVTAVGNAQLSTSVKKFGTASLKLDGTGDYCTVPSDQKLTNGSFESATTGATLDQYTTLMLHCDGTNDTETITDSSPRANTVTNVGNAKLKTATKKFGTASLLLSGSSQYATVPSDQKLTNGSFETWTGLTDLLTNGNMETWTGLGTQLLSNPDMETWTGLTDGLTNGNMEAGSPPSTWVLQGAGATWAREGTIKHSGSYSGKLTRNGVDTQVYQDVYTALGGVAIRNQTVVFSGWVYATVAGRARLWLYDLVGGISASAYHPGDSQWHFLTTTLTVAGTANNLIAYCDIDTGDTSAYFDDCKCYIQLAPTSWGSSAGNYWREEGITHGGTYSWGWKYSGSASDIYQDIENAGGHNLAYWAGKTVTFGIWMWSDSASNYIYMDNGAVTSGVVSHPGDSAWHYLTVSWTFPTSRSTRFFCNVLGAAGTLYIDDGLAYENIPPTGWAIGGYSEIIRESSITHGGTYSVKITHGTSNPALTQDPGTPSSYNNKTMVFGCWVYSSVPSSARLYVTDQAAVDYSSFHSGGGGWEYITCVHKCNASCTVFEVGLIVSSGTAYFDSAILYEQLAPTGWTFGGTGATVAREEGTVKVGTYSAKLTRNGADCYMYNSDAGTGTIFGQTIAYWKGRTVTMGCWVWASVAGRAKITISDAIAPLSSSYHTGSSTWEFLSVTLTVSQSASGLYCYPAIDTGDTTAYFDGAFVTDDAAANFTFGTGDFTIDKWIYPTALNGTICSSLSNDDWNLAADDDWALYADGNGYLTFYVKGLGVAGGGASVDVTENAWNHVEVSRSSGVITVFLNGVASATQLACTKNFLNRETFKIGKAITNLTLAFTGYIDEFRVSKGIARHTANFTPKTLAYGYTPDNWTLTGTGATVDIEESFIKVGSYSAKLTRNGADATLYQDVTASLGGLASAKGKTVTFGCWVYVTVASRARVGITDGVSGVFSSTHSGTPGWEYLSATYTINASATGVFAQGEIITGDTTAYFDCAFVTDDAAANFNFGSGNWTIDWWEYRTADTANTVSVAANNVETYSPFLLGYSTTTARGIYMSSNGTSWDIASGKTMGSLEVNTWTHLEVARSGNTFYSFKNGILQDSWTSSLRLPNSFSPFSIGAWIDTYFFSGYIDEFRVSKGVARHTASFTAPTSPYRLAYTGAYDLLAQHDDVGGTETYAVLGGDLLKKSSSRMDLEDSAAFTSGILCHAVSVRDNGLYITNSTDGLKLKTVGNDISVPTDVPPSACARIYKQKNRLLAEGSASYPKRVYGSRVGEGNWDEADAWTLANDAFSIDLPEDTRGVVTDFPSGDYNLVFTDKNAYAIGNFPNVSYRAIGTPARGCSAPYSIAKGDEGVYFASLYPTKGIFLFDGTSFAELTELNHDVFTDKIDFTKRIFGIYRDRRYHIWYNELGSGASYPNTYRIYDARFKRWMERPVNLSLADNFGYPALLQYASWELYNASSRTNYVYELETTDNSDEGFDTQATYTTKSFSSRDFAVASGGQFPIDDCRMKLLKLTITFFGEIGSVGFYWAADRGLHSGSKTIDLTSAGDMLNTTFIMNTSLMNATPQEKTRTYTFPNSAVGKRFYFQITNNGQGTRPKIKKIKVSAVTFPEP